MARAAVAAKRQLLARLRPFSVAGESTGVAPTELVPDVCRSLRSFTFQELQIILAAYAKHPPDLPIFRVRPTTPVPENATDSENADCRTVRLADVIVQLFVGGSRLGTTPQLLDASETIGLHAPCDCRAAQEFWSVFAEKIVRLSASNSLDPHQMVRVFLASSTWTERCGSFTMAKEKHGRKFAGPWGHMLRSIGGRLADPRHLDRLQLHDVVAVARYAARLGEPQHRLAAAVGMRVGSQPVDLESADIVDLIGAAGRLGGRLHMMTRALTDQLEPQVSRLPVHLLVRLCSHLGALEMFPQRVASALERELPQRIDDMSSEDLLELLRASGRLRWRVPEILGPLLSVVGSRCNLDTLSGATLGSVLYELYRLDLWDANVIETICDLLRPELGRVVPRKAAANLLLALAYFSHGSVALCSHLLQELMLSRDMSLEAVYQMKTFEMAVRVGHAAVSFDDLGPLAARWLLGIRKMSSTPEPRSESTFAEDVSAVARGIAWRHEAEVEVGPYLLDFAGLHEPEDPAEAAQASERKGRALARYCVAVEVDGPSHFYRPHDRPPWHWTASSKLRHRLLTLAGIRVAHVPHYDWAQLQNLSQKEAYLEELLSRTHDLPHPGRQPQAG
eukprot:TRINITY_DN57434_c0_g1_i1.p1 TRINITY_DN57434_c0_g1~~TRINITY_DN57434_c0_g1_i1.p1  ORF type:complete len:620 (-),score=65.32 TRINITY_DN57434_c0_g1_i1:88-1947(-)